MTKFIAAFDMHVGFENKNKHKVPLHDEKAINAMLKFASDFKPDTFVCGGDHLDCGPVSHWLQNSKKSSEGLDLGEDIELYTKMVMDPINKELKPKNKIWMVGNHENWINDAIEKNPGLSSVLDLKKLLPLSGWKFIQQGGHHNIGQYLYFIHGDTLPNQRNIAAAAVERYNKSIIFGHFHTYQAATKHSMLTAKEVKIGVAVPGLCKKNPNYLEGRPNQWLTGFCYGYVESNGHFTSYVPIIIDGKFMTEGKKYSG
jgi:metallophosphoesterase superfamily enzyme